MNNFIEEQLQIDPFELSREQLILRAEKIMEVYKKDKENPIIKSLFALNMALLGHEQIAATEYLEISKLMKNDGFDNLEQQAKRLIASNQKDEAVKILLEAMKVRPENQGVIKNLQQLYKDIGDEEGVQKMEKKLKNSLQYFKIMNMCLGNTLLKQKQYEIAASIFKAITELIPSTSVAYNNKGLCHYYLDQFEEAMQEFTRAIETNPLDAEYYYNLANTQIEVGKYEEASHNYQKTVELDPEYHYAYCGLATCYQKSNKKDEAIQAYKKCIEINPNLPTAYLNLASFLIEEKQYQQAQEILCDGVESDIEEEAKWKIYLLLSIACKHTNKLAESYLCFNKANNLNQVGVIQFMMKNVYNK